MKFDEILGKLGEFGKFQKRVYFLLGFPAISIGSFCVMVIVVLYTPKHRCKIPGLDNDTYAIQDSVHADLINRTIPLSSDPTLTYDQCHLFQYHQQEESHNVSVSKVACDDWVYDKTVFYDTFTSKIHLVCGDAMKTAHIQMLFYLGVLVGDFILGTIADLAGRKKALVLGFCVVLVSAIAVTFSPEFISFSVLQFIVGGAAHGAFIIIAVISLEIVGLSHRVWTGMLLQIFFAVGVCYVAIMAYLIRSWMWINLSCALPCIVYLAYWWCIPESPRWLLSKGRQSESAVIIERAAKLNKVQLSPDTYKNVKEETKGSDGRIWHVFTSPVLCKRILILFFNWMVISMTYFGVQMSAGNLGGDFFLNFLLMGIAEFPGYIAGIMLTDRIGRRLSHSGSMFVGGLACLSSLFVVYFGSSDLTTATPITQFYPSPSAHGHLKKRERGMTISATYYGVQMNAGNLSDDYHLSFLLMGFAEIPGVLLGLALLYKFGRRWTNCATQVLAGVSCLATMVPVLLQNLDLQPLTIALAFIGKAGSSAAFGIVYIFTAELLPTVVRNAGMGVCSCAARVGAMLAPYIAKSGELIGGNFGKVFPLVVFGALSIVAGLLLLILPETLNQKLPDTIEEGENFGRNKTQVDEKELEVPFISESKIV